jgi:hypothetical protein
LVNDSIGKTAVINGGNEEGLGITKITNMEVGRQAFRKCLPDGMECDIYAKMVVVGRK